MSPVLITYLSTAAGLVSAGLWFYASIIKVPTEIGSAFGELSGVKEMSAGFKKQSFWNAVAAAATGMAVLLDLVAKALPPG